MRKAKLERKTKETQIKILLNIDGKGKSQIKTPIFLLNHLLEIFSFFGLFDLELFAKGDEFHHINEDIGIILGKVFKEALGDRKGIERFGFSYAPMGEALARCVVDISGRPALYFSSLGPKDLNFQIKDSKSKYSLLDFKSFLEGFCQHARITINVGLLQREDLHHQLEAIFKSLALALKEAVKINPLFKRRVPSTKGVLD